MSETDKILSDLNNLYNEQKIIRQEYRMRQKKYLMIGILFLISAIFCTIAALILNKPLVIIGAIAQFSASISLIIRNSADDYVSVRNDSGKISH